MKSLAYSRKLLTFAPKKRKCLQEAPDAPTSTLKKITDSFDGMPLSELVFYV